MLVKLVCAVCCLLWTQGFSQPIRPHANAHAHNDYEHVRPLLDALQNGFISVEADIHFRNGRLVVDHTIASGKSPLLERLYLKPLDSLLRMNNGEIYSSSTGNMTFFLMLDVKTTAEPAWEALKQLLKTYSSLCNSKGIRIFLSGNRPIQVIQKEQNSCVGVDGRPDDLGKNYPETFMPVISDHYKNWSKWNGKTTPTDNDLAGIRELALRVHKEGKRLRLWSIPDNEMAWDALLKAGVDLINTDRLEELNVFLTKKDL
ncbi:MAG TPA: hypothetical protein PLR06_02310 [Cyclobacteriaceae bacterium]|nr:hypothetical protein [Cyclobacteriaceae bacterium]